MGFFQNAKLNNKFYLYFFEKLTHKFYYMKYLNILFTPMRCIFIFLLLPALAAQNPQSPSAPSGARKPLQTNKENKPVDISLKDPRSTLRTLDKPSPSPQKRPGPSSLPPSQAKNIKGAGGAPVAPVESFSLKKYRAQHPDANHYDNGFLTINSRNLVPFNASHIQ